MRDPRVKLELLSRAHKRHAFMMQSMQSSVAQGFAQLSSQLATAGGSHAMGGGHNGGNTGHVDEMARISEVKAAFRRQFPAQFPTLLAVRWRATWEVTSTGVRKHTALPGCISEPHLRARQLRP
ncbi:hypothetical protein I4F81_004523 [Pyropia yezoensis]|uniref:Uncharacterized protein n=1 Tax=Pyropia yezoensis TaxID=2788 RepID=A0ACC3BVL6_PYRYE|nr:hypothetical protein I4F81_004523 [Neopyropia yezoensis]